MRLNLTVRHGQVNAGVRSYVEAKFAKLGRRLHDGTLVEVVLDRERNPKIADDHVVEAELHVKGPNLHGREAAASYEAATDLLVDKLERQIERLTRQESAGAAAPRAGRPARAGARRGDRAGAPRGVGRLSRPCRCHTTQARTGARSGSTGCTVSASGTRSSPSRLPTSPATRAGSSSSRAGRSSSRSGMVPPPVLRGRSL